MIVVQSRDYDALAGPSGRSKYPITALGNTTKQIRTNEQHTPAHNNTTVCVL